MSLPLLIASKEIPAPSLATIERLQEVMAQMPNLEMQTNHYFSDGMYCRELLIPAGTTLVGKVHKKEHLCILSQGEMTIVGDGYRKTITAPCIFNSTPGAKRAGFAHSDSIFVTVHATKETDMALLEQELVEDDPNAMYITGNVLKIEAIK